MTANRDIGRMALKQAIMVRRELDVPMNMPIDVVDAAEKLGVEVMFQDIPSLEGMYVKADYCHILLPSDRPLGRQMFACAHELGHHRFGHGTRADEYRDHTLSPRSGPRDPDEVLVDMFAGHLLLPRAAIELAFQLRNWNAYDMTPSQAYVIAGSMGVSFRGFINHLAYTLKMIDGKRAEELKKEELPAIRHQILGRQSTGHLVVADEQCLGFAVNLWVGDRVLLPRGAVIESAVLQVVDELPVGVLAEAIVPGRTRAATHNWCSFIRVSRARFVGRSIFRFVEEEDAD